MPRKMIDTIDDGPRNGNNIAKKMTVLQTIHTSHNAWTKVTTSCIVNCFKKSGMVSITTSTTNNKSLELDIPVDVSRLQMHTETFNE